MGKTSLLLCLFLIGFSGLSHSQNLGVSNSNYAPTNAVLLNPSASADAWLNFDMQLLGTSAGIKNNYLHLPRENFFIYTNPDFSFVDDFSAGALYRTNFEVDILLPAFSKVIYDHAFGGFVRFRAIGNAHNIPADLAKFMFEGFQYDEQQDTEYDAKDYMFKSMSWGEIGANYSVIALRRDHHMITVGGSLKRLIGYHNASFYFEETSYEVTGLNIDIKNLTGRYGLAVPEPDGNGKGWGFDIGATYYNTIKPCNYYSPYNRMRQCEKREYDYKIGLSILDIGGIRFDESTLYREFDNASATWVNFPATSFTGFTEFDTQVEAHFGKNNSAQERADEYRAMLPTSLVLEVDKRFQKHFYLNSTALYGFRSRENLGVSRMSFFSLAPRFEKQKYEVSLPLRLFPYKSPDLGVFLRAGGFYFGTGNIIPFLFNVDIWGANIFMGFKYNIPYNKQCKETERKTHNWWCPGCPEGNPY